MTHPARHYQADTCHVTEISNYEIVTVCWCQHCCSQSTYHVSTLGGIRSEHFASKKASRSNS